MEALFEVDSYIGLIFVNGYATCSSGFVNEERNRSPASGYGKMAS